MKKLITLIIVASLALTIQAQDITNTLSATGNFKVNKNDGTTNLFTLSETGEHTMKFSTTTTGFQIKNSAGATVFHLNDMADQDAFATFIVGAEADVNWDGGNFAHLQMQQSAALYGTAANHFKMIGRGAHNFITGMYSRESGSNATDVGDGDNLLSVRGEGYFNGSYRKTAYIVMQVDGTPAGNFVPGELIFGTGTDAADPAARMTIKSDGKVGIGTETPNSTLNVAGSISLGYASGGNITLDGTHYVYAANGGSTITLPTAVGITGRVYIIKSTASTVTVNSSNSENIDLPSTTTYALTAQGKYVTLISNGAAWLIIGQN